LSQLTRRNFFRQGAGGIVAGALVAGDGVFFEAARLQIIAVEVPLVRLPEAWDGFRILQLSDIHYDDIFSVVPLRKAINDAIRLQPDLIVLTGDFVTSPMNQSRKWGISKEAKAKAKAIEPCVQLLSKLLPRFQILAVVGNHDACTDAPRITDALQSSGISVLTNRAISLERVGKRLWLAGVDDVLDGVPDLDRALAEIPPTEPVVLLAHEPDWADHVAKYPVDLQLSGHSHGGQIRIPLIGAPYLPEMGRKYPRGLRQLGSLFLYTNCGIGTIRIPMRLDCPPEITLVTLRTSKLLPHHV
jgi:predicted MPP superfamily phosphohydrolase